MRRIAVAVLCLIFAIAAPLGADCPTVYNIDDPPCAPSLCPYLPVGPQYPRFAVWPDWSEIVWTVQRQENCDGDGYSAVVAGSVGVYCPNGPSEPCGARDSGWLP